MLPRSRRLEFASLQVSSGPRGNRQCRRVRRRMSLLRTGARLYLYGPRLRFGRIRRTNLPVVYRRWVGPPEVERDVYGPRRRRRLRPLGAGAAGCDRRDRAQNSRVWWVAAGAVVDALRRRRGVLGRSRLSRSSGIRAGAVGSISLRHFVSERG